MCDFELDPDSTRDTIGAVYFALMGPIPVFISLLLIFVTNTIIVLYLLKRYQVSNLSSDNRTLVDVQLRKIFQFLTHSGKTIVTLTQWFEFIFEFMPISFLLLVIHHFSIQNYSYL